MAKVIIVCIQGVTSSVMAKKLNILAKQKNENYEFQAVSVADIHDYLDEPDYVLLTPQVKSKFNDIFNMSKDYHCEIGILEESNVSFNNIELTYYNLKSIIEKENREMSVWSAFKKTCIDILIFCLLLCSIGGLFYELYHYTNIGLFYEVYQKTSGVICLYVAYAMGAFFAKYLHQSSFIYGSACVLTLIAYSFCSFSLIHHIDFQNSIDLISMLCVNDYGINHLFLYSIVVFCGLFIFHYLNIVIRKKSEERHYFSVGYFHMPNHILMASYLFIIILFSYLSIIIF